ncbi:hypothetical protein COV06_01650 [Candidatus Uhrbacteria bacterium CG10_big_fil_rev_8_21_14_0_10_50_16]|uniref:N-acetyltransferase domain-containing protein n=1 Tax=Candidatus Uhrbacteria bacterium CG10_big_fil_rev_8_21_14_0_10_50_16 TaxID=1975039 RepID=A0A2H0RNL1_9BACT|nr:MAG: hypothetical protein COV06_01650 [Candidatus Uhrbacteria bacterium CG10_big_fil_rev_8_21_14_0_10_50_16]
MEPQKPVVFLQGVRLYLRPLEVEDAPCATRWINHPETRKWLGSRGVYNLAREQAWIESLYQDENEIVLAIVLNEGNRHIGNIGLHRIDHLNQSAVTGMLIGEVECRGCGYGPEAKELLLGHAFNTLNLRTVRSATVANNLRSNRSLQKSGYVEVGRMPDQFFRDGTWHDELLWVLTRDRWLARHA